MTNTRKSPRKANLAAVAAFGIASLGALGAAGAHPGHTTPYPAPQPKPVQPAHYDDYGYQQPVDYDIDDDGVLEHVEVDYRHYDRNRDGVLGTAERTAYWTHMFDMGKFGGGFSRADKTRLARIAYLFDRDADGRLTQEERVAISRLIRARKVFISLDRNRDNTVTRREAGMSLSRYEDGRRYIQPSNPGIYGGGNFFYWDRIRAPEPTRSINWVSRRFQTLDRNRNGRVSWNEVETHVILSFRRGTPL